MKTIEAFIKEIEGSVALQDELKTTKDQNELAEFMKKNGCEAAVEELINALIAEAEGEISDDSAEAAAGGIQAGNLLKKYRTEFSPFLPTWLPVTTKPETFGRKYPHVL